jgi:hypothetical protein
MALGIAVIEAWGLFLPSNAAPGHAGIASWITILNNHFSSIGVVFVVATLTIWLSLWLLYRVRNSPSAPAHV